MINRLSAFLLLIACSFSTPTNAQMHIEGAQPHFINLTSAGVQFLNGGGFLAFKNTSAFNVTSGLYVGAGVGAEFLAQDAGTWTYLPAFLDVRYAPLEDRVSWVVILDVGYSINPINYGYRYGSGFMIAPGVGLTVPVFNSSHVEFDLGFVHQVNDGTEFQNTSLNLMSFGIGFIP